MGERGKINSTFPTSNSDTNHLRAQIVGTLKMLMTMKNKRILRLFPVPNVLIFPISPRFAGHQVVQISRRGYSIELFPSFPCGLSFLPYVYGLGFGLSQKAIESRGCAAESE